MHLELQSFADELSKIAEAQNAYSKDKLMRAAGVGLASSGAFGLGWGLGSAAAERGLIPYLSKKFPHPTTSQMRKGMLALGGLGMMASLANQLWKKKALDYINKPPEKGKSK